MLCMSVILSSPIFGCVSPWLSCNSTAASLALTLCWIPLALHYVVCVVQNGAVWLEYFDPLLHFIAFLVNRFILTRARFILTSASSSLSLVRLCFRLIKPVAHMCKSLHLAIFLTLVYVSLTAMTCVPLILILVSDFGSKGGFVAVFCLLMRTLSSILKFLWTAFFFLSLSCNLCFLLFLSCSIASCCNYPLAGLIGVTIFVLISLPIINSLGAFPVLWCGVFL